MIMEDTSLHNLINERLNVIRGLQSPSGLFLAAAKDVTTGYDKAWLRDNFYTSLAFEWAGDYETVARVYHAILDIFLKHEDKIDLATKERPHQTWQYIHARYHPETFEEYWEEWGNKQNDAVGAVLFKIGMLEREGHSILRSDDDRRVLQRLVDYLASIEYWKDGDNGVWEEYEEVHASSVGACVAGLKSMSALPFIVIPEGLILRGEETLRALLPRESVSKFCDLALLSLMFPYNLLEADMERAILSNLEYHLTKERGVIRYKTDRYYNKNTIDKWSEEAEWTMGFPWLAIIYAKQGNREKAQEYLRKTEAVLWDGKLPELYYSDSEKPNDNIPLAWSESLYIVAMIEVATLT
jgi:phosphorylase kinase alpha/beta subunit